MIINWISQSDYPAAQFSQPELDVFAIEHFTQENDPRASVALELAFTDTTAAEYIIPEEAQPYVQSAVRVNGVLVLDVVSHHFPNNALTNRVSIDYGTQEELIWPA